MFERWNVVAIPFFQMVGSSGNQVLEEGAALVLEKKMRRDFPGLRIQIEGNNCSSKSVKTFLAMVVSTANRRDSGTIVGASPSGDGIDSL